MSVTSPSPLSPLRHTPSHPSHFRHISVTHSFLYSLPLPLRLSTHSTPSIKFSVTLRHSASLSHSVTPSPRHIPSLRRPSNSFNTGLETDHYNYISALIEHHTIPEAIVILFINTILSFLLCSLAQRIFLSLFFIPSFSSY